MYQQNYGPRGYVPRGIIIFLQVMGTLTAIIGLVVYISYMNDVSQAISNDDPTGKATAALILGILTYFAWKTVYAAVAIIRFIKKSTDDEIVANRYIIMALSLNLGGFWTPFIMSSLPNVPTISTINPRWFLSKAMGITSLVGAALAMIAFFISALTGPGALTNSVLFDTSQTAGVIGSVMLGLSIVVLVFGLITTILFYQRNSRQIFDQGNTAVAKLMNIVGTIWLVVLTVELAITMLYALVRLLGAIVDLFQAMSQDGAGKIMFIFMAMWNLMVTFVYVGYIIYLTTRTMLGLWSRDGVEYHSYENLTRAKQNAQNRKFA